MSIAKFVLKTVFNYFYPQVVVKKPVIPKKVRLQLWLKYHGNSSMGHCYACDRPIDDKNYHASHVLSHKHGGTIVLDNLRTCCSNCNLRCGKQNLYAFIKQHKLTGLGASHMLHYFKLHPDQLYSKR